MSRIQDVVEESGTRGMKSSRAIKDINDGPFHKRWLARRYLNAFEHLLGPFRFEAVLGTLVIILLHKARVFSPTPLPVLLSLLLASVVTSWLARSRLEGSSPKAAYHLWIGLQMLSVAALIYATGWGPILAVGYLFSAGHLIHRLGTRATVPSLVWSLVGIVFGQIAVTSEVVASQIDVQQATPGALVGALGLVFAIRMIHITVRERELAMGRLKALADRDSLTGLYNRNVLLDSLDRAISQADRTSTPVSVLLFDLDEFKRVNDTYGHLVGDQVLRSVAARLQASSRGMDIVGRYGGEEFLVILPVTDDLGALTVAQRLLDTATGAPHPYGELLLEAKASVGIATYPQDGGGRDALIDAADAAMYEAKRAGGSQCRSAKYQNKV